MKQIKITEGNMAAIQAALDEVNGDASAHVFCAETILNLAQKAEARLVVLNIPKSRRAGAEATATRSPLVAVAYRYKRKATFVRIIRRSNSWWLCRVESVERYPVLLNQCHEFGLTLTPEQDARRSRSNNKKQNHARGRLASSG